jgi:hypothetical protein
MPHTRSWKLAEIGVALLLALGTLTMSAAMPCALSQSAPAAPTTTVQDTVYRADGTPAGGTVLISWPAFVTATGINVAAGNTSVTLGAGGVLSVALVANNGSNPMGSYYTVIYQLNDGTTSREYWVVPVSASPVALSTIRSTVLPASVAMQTVSKAYVDTAIANAVFSPAADPSPYVLKTGDTMTGPLVLPGDPTAPLQASDKNYVDEQTAALTAGLAQKVSVLPTATQTVTQPLGTQLGVNTLNGEQYASRFQTGGGNNGIANAASSTNCTSGCGIVAEPVYPATEQVNVAALPRQTYVEDKRSGSIKQSFNNPLNFQSPGDNSAASMNVVSTQTAPQILATAGNGNIFSRTLKLTNQGLAGGSNIFPEHIQGTVPYFKTTFSALSLTGIENTLGQHVLDAQSQNCYGVGDCLMGSREMVSSGGYRDDADEGAHPYDLSYSEDRIVFAGTCASGCTAGSTNLQITATAGPGTQGEGRYLIDKNPAHLITTGSLIASSGSTSSLAIATFSGTSFPVSTYLQSAATIPTQANNIAPGTVTIPIVTSGVPAGFATSTAALPATSGVACIVDEPVGDGRALNLESAAYSVVDASHLQLVLNKPHGLGSTIAVGGLCGYGLEQTVDTANGIRQIFPVIGSPSSTTLNYLGSGVATQGLQNAYVNLSLVIQSIARSGNVVTLTTAGNLPFDVNGLTLTVQGVVDSSYNGSFLVTTTGPNSLTYASTGPNSSSSGGTLTMLTGSYVLYPMAEVLNVFNPATSAVDGQMTLAANTVNWASGDAVEQPHFYQQRIAADVEYVTQYMPRANAGINAGIYYQGNNGPGLEGWQIANQTPITSYFGNGGTHAVPSLGISVTGPWFHSMELEAGENAAIEVHCNMHGCGNWNSTYDLLQMDSNAGQDHVTYSPSASTLNLTLRGTAYQFTPTGLTAGTINATTINATNVSGALTGSFSGTVTPGSVPVFGASGVSHATGSVPDPGATAGNTRFLREDGTWSPAAGVEPPTAYSASTTYAQFALVTSGSTVYQSQSSGNTGNAVTNTTYWQPIAAANGAGSAAVQALFGTTAPALKQVPVGTSAGVYTPTPLTPAFIGALAAPPLPVTPMADFQFIEQSGPTVYDQLATGNGNGALQTASGRTPTWYAGGLQFANGQGVDLPAAYNSAQSWCFAVNLTPLGLTNFNATGYSILLSSNAGVAGSNLMLEYAGSLVNNGLGYSPGPGIAAPVVFSTSVKTTVNKPISGIHRLCYVLGTSGTSIDHIYDNGQEFDSYGLEGAGAGTQTSSFLTIGSANVSPWSSVGLFGSTVYRALPFASALTPAQVLAVDQNMVGNLIDRGVQPTPPLPVLSAPQLIFLGDSLTACYQVSPASACWNQNLTLTNQPAYVKSVFAVTGLTALAISGAEPGRVGQYCQGTQGNANVVLWEGTNDLASFVKETPQLVAQNIWGAVDRLSAAGCNVYLSTIISRGGNAGDGGTFETERQQLNTLLRQGLKAHSARGIIDLAANPLLGATGANASTTYFYSDNVHLLAAAQPAVEAAVNNSLNFYNGATLAAPAVYTASATLPSSARAVDATGCTATCAFVLPDGTGPTGEEYIILTGSATVTVQGQTLYGQTQTVNGSSSAVTLPANTKVTLRTVALPQATAGVKWVY